ncbi:restriction endonuclease subunit S [Enterococcus gilvus]|uniref:restriction endonuclease subunit S n=1 Tax=Enterococcus gilvus TaxID=160453 RepID=UPI0028D55889|nr:restriction endonuclease subunit S [Enterococcus gilvus]
MQNKKQPEVRFANYEGEWKEKNLSEVVDVHSGRDYKHLESGDIPVYGTGGYMLSVSEALSHDKDAIGIGRKGTIDKPYILHSPFWTVDTLFYTIPRKRFDLNFVFGIFQQINWKKKDESTGVPSLSKMTINSVKVDVPDLEEQQKIGILFNKIDADITLHQQELARLKQTKQGFLQKMFPKEGERVPEVRFPGFNDDWDHQRLESAVEVKSGRDYKHLKKGDIPVYGTGGYMLSVNEALSDTEDAIGIGRKGTIDKPYLLKAPFWTVDTLFYSIPKKGYDLDFVNNIFQRINWKKMDESTGVPSLSKAVINAIQIQIPSFEEQKMIGCFFKQFDETITLHQRDLEFLQLTKKAFLQKLFV